jgi:hypothetical protein
MMWREVGTSCCCQSHIHLWHGERGEKGVLHTHLVLVVSAMWRDAPHEEKYASMIPMYTAPEKVVVQRPRTDLGEISER